MKGRGRRATFPEIDAPPPEEVARTKIIETADPRRFHVVLDSGDAQEVDLTQWSHPSFSTAMAPLLHEHIRQLGPAPIGRSIYYKVHELKSFWTFLDATDMKIDGLDDLTADLIDSYEGWLRQNGKAEHRLRRLLSALIALLRMAAENHPGRFPPTLEYRLSWLSGGEYIYPRVRDAYSSGVATALRVAARRQIAEAAARILLGDDMPAPRADIAAHPKLNGLYAEVLVALARDGALCSRVPPLLHLKRGTHNNGRPNLSSTTLHGALYLTRLDLIAFLVLLSLDTGMEIECVKGLKADCLRNPTRGYVEIEYCKRRAQGAEWKHLRIRDGASSTPGAIVRLAISLTERARRYLGTDGLWAWWDGFKLLEGKNSRRSVDAFVAHHRLVDDDGRPLHLHLSRLRKTHKAERYLHTQGQLADFAIGHSIAVAANHYADIPALRHVHEQTVASALYDALDTAFRPTLVPPEIEEAVRADPQSIELPIAAEQVPALLAGDEDVWLASCGGYYASPFASVGEPCPTPFWGCLECKNAVITARKLPALIAFDTFMIEQRGAMDEAAWSARFGRAHRRIAEQIIPAFPPQLVADARAAAVKDGSSPDYLPPEVRVW
ncbi:MULTISPECIES: hypothetical protein [Sphingomonadaceae]|uniref:hypothetical protein n=1 Tax=Sphingomonadales TaxID=204457 RepID=UPI001F1D6078|nr:hypothetical protein [Sphingobium sp. JS3065]MCF8708639.1 hypothetical protein [Rhizorhapis sp. SPR117]UZW56022.1 hypothetical protein NUH86_04320 [Sphingobium sp. JS3065]